MRYSPSYPASVAEVLDPPVRFRRSAIEVVMRFARAKPYGGTEEERKSKFATLHHDLRRIYGKGTRLTFGVLDGGDSGGSSYCPMTDEITLIGRLSVVTYLHEFAHALGKDERGAVRWSANLFRVCFPRSFARCQFAGHMLRKPPAGGAEPSAANPPTEVER